MAFDEKTRILNPEDLKEDSSSSSFDDGKTHLLSSGAFQDSDTGTGHDLTNDKTHILASENPGQSQDNLSTSIETSDRHRPAGTVVISATPGRLAQQLTRLGKYEIQEELGRGAMGVVYKAHDTIIGRTVALKTVRTDLLEHSIRDEVLERFKQEAKAAGRLTHAGIVTIYEYAYDNGIAFIAMEFIEGQELSQYLKPAGNLAPDFVISIVSQLLDALDFAHRQGIIHRDIKPSNIILTPDHRVKLADFGIARIDTTTLTQDGRRLGTPAYMSPEQCLGNSIDARSDIFSVGSILYHMLTGSPPFAGDNPMTTMKEVVNHFPPAPSSVNITLPKTLDDIVARAMAKKPGDRFSSARDFYNELRVIPLAPSPAPKKKTKSKLPISIALAVVLVAAGYLLYEQFKPVPWEPATTDLDSIATSSRDNNQPLDGVAITQQTASGISETTLPGSSEMPNNAVPVTEISAPQVMFEGKTLIQEPLPEKIQHRGFSQTADTQPALESISQTDDGANEKATQSSNDNDETQLPFKIIPDSKPEQAIALATATTTAKKQQTPGLPFHIEPETSQQYVQPGAQDKAPSQPLQAESINLLLTTAGTRQPALNVGEKVVIQIQSDQEAYLYCFYQDYKGLTMRILPNRFTASHKINKNASLSVPESSDGFEIIMEEPGSTEVMKCIATGTIIPDDIPSLAIPDLSPINMSLKQIENQIRNRSPGSFGTATLYLTVN